MERSTRFDILRQSLTNESVTDDLVKSTTKPTTGSSAGLSARLPIKPTISDSADRSTCDSTNMLPNPRPRPRPRRHGARVRFDSQRKWLQFANSAPLDSYEDFHNIYAYSRLKLAFPWAQIFRAGMIVFAPVDISADHKTSQGVETAGIRKPGECSQLLVIQQRGGTIIRDGAKRKLPSYMGLPKGSADASDTSAFHTAIRELREETGIDIDRNARNRATVSPVVFVIIREEVREVSIYFAVLLKSRPDVVVCAEEIIGHQWVSADRVTEIKEISIPTGMLFRAMGAMDYMHSY